MKHRLAVTTFAMVALVLTGCASMSPGDYEPLKKIPLTPESWSVLFTGQGEAAFETEGLRLRPKAPSKKNETYAALVVLRADPSFRYFKVKIRYEVRRQLRAIEPAAWEVLWVLFNFRNSSSAPSSPAPMTEWRGEKETNYFILKPNGVELGLASRKVDQKFLVTHELPRLTIGQIQTVTIERGSRGTRVFVERDGEADRSFTYRDRESAATYDHLGTVGLYTEDAEVLVRSVEFARPIEPSLNPPSVP